MASAQIEWGDKHPQLEWIGDITRAEVAKHNTKDDCWCIFQGYVYNMTSYLKMHPGGPQTILVNAGGDMTEDFMARHRWISPNLISKIKIGKLVD